MGRKSIIIIASLIITIGNAHAQERPFDYNTTWGKIDSLILKKGLVQSALQEIDNVYAHAKRENNEAQLIKTLLYKMSIQQKTDENALMNGTAALDKEILSIKEPAKSVLLSIEAGLYWSYFQQNRWRLYDRTATVNFKKKDPLTWGIDDFHKKISELYLASIKYEGLLQQTKLKPFDAVIIKGNVRNLRPTLFDLLTHRALEYFTSDERYISKPAYAFELNSPEIFADKSVFSRYHFKITDSASLHYKALQLFQGLLLFHDHDIKPDALIDVDIERLQFAHQYGVMDNKDELYFKSLQNITGSYPDEPAAAQAWYLQAQQYADKASRYNPVTDTANRLSYLPAKQICERVMAQQDSSEGKANCAGLLRQINKKELSLQLEKVNVPALPFRALVSYRNCTTLYFRIINANRAIREGLGNQWQDDYWKKVTRFGPIKSFQQVFSGTNDYQKHSAEIKVDSLPVGEYALLASPDADFSLDKSPITVAFFYVSNIAYINNGSDYFVLNRETGQPIARASVQAWYQYYDGKQNKYLERKGENFSTDKNGSFTIVPSKTQNNNQLKLEFTTSNDHLFIDNNAYQYAYREDGETPTDRNQYEKKNLRSFLFTDRSIYRPGQTVYFKGIVTTKDFDTKQPKILPQFKTKVILYDVNEQEADSVFVTTNDFGSYNGKFKLPEGLLNGEFKIADDSTEGEQAFSVEEYKRPKFYLSYDKLKGSYRLNDTIGITGFAKAYSGNNIDGATVKYSVTRRANFPYPWLYWRWGMPQSASQEIAHGEIKTNAAGNFFIRFKAIPDNSIRKELAPVFEYAVSADVTDINGETRSSETQVSVGYKALDLSINLPYGDNLPADSLKNILIKTRNLSGEFEPTNVNVAIYKLQSPNRLIRQRYWQQPDQFVMNKEEYLRYFPNDEYSNETKKETWQKEQKVFEKTDSTKESSIFFIDRSSFNTGWYVIEATAKDKYGEEVKNIKYIQLFDPKTGRPASPQYNWAYDNYQVAEPGKKAITSMGSSANEVFVIEKSDYRPAVSDSSVQSGGNWQAHNYSFFQMNNEKRSTGFIVTENDRGGFGVSYAFVKNNRFYTSNNIISVPWTNKELSISYETYRDKTLPGSEEKWKVKISGYRKDKVVAEVLTSMYDASLDQFNRHSWSTPDIYQENNPYSKWDNQSNFISVFSQQTQWKEYEGPFFKKNYDRLLNTGSEEMGLRIRGYASALMGDVSGVQIMKKKQQ
ncbi:MAG: hypothetical protein JST47_05595 [Bacteroidetes bacterium]|nr:hypothetical protein [Bacteroidota bacterium]